MRLIDGLRAGKHSRVAFVGAGGKTTTMFSLARQLKGPVICINTAHLAVDQARLADHHSVITSESEVKRSIGVDPKGILLLTGPLDDRGRLQGLSETIAEEVCRIADKLTLPVLVEADGSRMRPLKAPAAHEPPIPSWVNQVVVLVGLSAIGQPLTEENVFRPDVFMSLCSWKLGEPITLDMVCQVVVHPHGGIKNIPAKAQRSLLFNQTDACKLPEFEIISKIKTCFPAFDSILLGSLQRSVLDQIQWRHEAVGGVVLAAGGSTRMGMVKQLLPWRGKSLVRHVAELAINSGLNPIVVVTGASSDLVREQVNDLPVMIVENEDWQSGQASSVRIGTQTLPNSCGAVLFLLSDMPQVPAVLVQAILDQQSRQAAAIISPRVNGQRSNPVLFDRVTFADLAALTGDTGGRVLFDQFQVEYLDYETSEPWMDIDTLDDYQKLMDEGNSID